MIQFIIPKCIEEYTFPKFTIGGSSNQLDYQTSTRTLKYNLSTRTTALNRTEKNKFVRIESTVSSPAMNIARTSRYISSVSNKDRKKNDKV